jgi:Ca-activated chloride channel family protein
VTPRSARAVVIALAAAAVLVAAAGWDERGTSETDAASELVLRYLYSPDAADLLVPLIGRFNRESHRLGGREIRIAGAAVTSGEAEAALAAGTDRAALWTPASSLWGALLDHEAAADWVPSESPHLVFSPQVIAMWRTLARAFESRGTEIGWKDVVALAASRRGWAEYGHPAYGPFLLAQTNPGYSTSGLSAVASEYYAATGKRSGLSLADVRRPGVRAEVRRIERSLVHYGETAEKLLAKMRKYGRGYAHAAYVQETTLRKFNRKLPPAKRLAAIVPADGTFVADYPLIALAAPWVSADARAAARAFRAWLVPKVTPARAARSGFRARRPRGLPELEPPAPEVLDELQDAWHEDRKPANIVLVVDTSRSMDEGGRLEAVQQGLLSFLRELSPQDRVALVTSGDSIETNVPLGVLGTRRPAVSRAIRELFPNGDAPVYPAVGKALDDLRGLDDPDRINAIVVVSDGAGSSEGRKELLRTIAAEPITEGTSVRIFTVGYGEPADAEALRQVASESDGLFLRGRPEDISDVYRRILSYF